MLGAIYTGLSGMNAYSQGLQTISNNVANLNSPGYKSTTTNFSDVFNYGGSGLSFAEDSNNGSAGSGVRFSGDQVNFGQGDLRQSDGNLDLAIQGSGFLVLLEDGKTQYARTGQFIVDKDGYISLQGTEKHLAILDASGRPVAVNVDTKRTNPPVATKTVRFSDNLSSSATTATVSDIAIYDSLGAKQVWQVKFDLVANSQPREWTVTVTDQTGANVATSSLRFIGGIVDPSTTKLTITNNPAGADPLSVVLDFSQGVTSLSGGTTSTLRAASVDGNGMGALSSVTVDADGKLKLTYSNSKTELLGAVALADFRDPQKLERIGNGLFEDRHDARSRVLGSGVDGMGRLVSKQIEASNVDLSQQFGELILIQRGFQASSQVVSVSNDMIQQLFGIRGQG